LPPWRVFRLGNTHLAAIVQDLETDLGGLAVLRVFQRQVRQMDRRFFGDNAAFLRRRLALMPAHHVHATHQGSALARHDPIDLALLALVAAGEDDHLVTLFDLGGRHLTAPPAPN
jgi:ABC-type multidrug transport system fused ATPase/permease subunit